MDKRRVFGTVVVFLIMGSLFYGSVYSTMKSAERRNQTITELHQEADTQTKTIKTLQTTVEQQNKKIQDLQKQLDATKKEVQTLHP